MTNDEYLQSQVGPLLMPGEQVLQSAYMRRQPGLAAQMFLVGGLLLFLITKAYFAVLTNRRLILIRTKMGFWGGGPKQMNLGVEQYDVRAINGCTTSGFANNRSMTWTFHQGEPMTLRISPWGKKIAGTAQFLEQVPQMITSGYLAQGAGNAPPLPSGPINQLPPAQALNAPPMQQPPMQQPPMQQPPMHQQMQQPPMHQQMQQPHMPPPGPQTFAPGTRVTVFAPDGNRYPATVAQVGQGQYLCTMPDGKPYWFPMQSVSIG
jgi:hypothetical protein